MKNDEKLTPNTQHTEFSQASFVDLNGPLRQVTAVACSDGWKPHDILLCVVLFDNAPLYLLACMFIGEPNVLYTHNESQAKSLRRHSTPSNNHTNFEGTHLFIDTRSSQAPFWCYSHNM